MWRTKTLKMDAKIVCYRENAAPPHVGLLLDYCYYTSRWDNIIHTSLYVVNSWWICTCLYTLCPGSSLLNISVNWPIVEFYDEYILWSAPVKIWWHGIFDSRFRRSNFTSRWEHVTKYAVHTRSNTYNWYKHINVNV